jgi:hypothetical protein
MALDLPVIAYAAAGVADTIGNAGSLIHDNAPETILGHLLQLHDDRVFRSTLIRKQRERARWFGREHVETELQRWLERMGALSSVPSRIGGALARRWGANAAHGVELGSFETLPVDARLPSRVHYVLEGPFETSYSLACDNREMALALNQREGRVGYIEPADGVEDYSINVEAANQLPQAIRDLVRSPPVTGERFVTIRQMHRPRPKGMLGDIRLLHLPWEESEIPPSLAGLINIHVDGVLAASEFCKRVARNSGVRVPIAVIGDGIDHFRTPETRKSAIAARSRYPRLAIYLPAHLVRAAPEGD